MKMLSVCQDGFSKTILGLTASAIYHQQLSMSTPSHQREFHSQVLFFDFDFCSYFLVMRNETKNMNVNSGPGLVNVSELAKYWNVSRPTAEKRCAYLEKQYDLQPSGGKGKRYKWSDIWASEGYSIVPEMHWSRMKEPLLKSAELADPGAYGRSERSIRRQAAAGKIPTVDLGISDYRFRACEIENVEL